MAAKDLGTKHTCFKCGTKFYDMKKPTPICPKCGADQRDSPALKPAPSERRARAAARPVEPVAEVDVDELEEDAEGDDEADEEVADEDEDV